MSSCRGLWPMDNTFFFGGGRRSMVLNLFGLFFYSLLNFCCSHVIVMFFNQIFLKINLSFSFITQRFRYLSMTEPDLPLCPNFEGEKDKLRILFWFFVETGKIKPFRKPSLPIFYSNTGKY